MLLPQGELRTDVSRCEDCSRGLLVPDTYFVVPEDEPGGEGKGDHRHVFLMYGLTKQGSAPLCAADAGGVSQPATVQS